VVLYDDNRVAAIDEPIQDVQQFLNVLRVQARSGLVQDVEDIGGQARPEFRRNLQPLGLPPGQRRGRLAETQVAQPDLLEDGDLRLTESSAILKYLADKIGSPAYPKDLKQRARVNEVMDWLNTNFYREYGYNLVYPQLFAHLRRPTEESQRVTLEWGKEKSKGWLQILNDHWLGPKNQYLCGDQITIADYFGAAFVTLGEIIRCDLSPYPNVQRWLGNMKRLRSWPKVNEVMYGFAGSVKDQSFTAL